VRIGNYYVAHEAFTKVRDEFESDPAPAEAVLVRSRPTPYFDNLVGQDLESFDHLGLRAAAAAKWVKSEPASSA